MRGEPSMAGNRVSATDDGLNAKMGREGYGPGWENPAYLRRKLALFVLIGVTVAGGPLATPAGAAAAQTPASASELSTKTASGTTQAAKPAAKSPGVHYVGGQLEINVSDTTLADVLAQVAKLTGVKIDAPPAASSEKMPVVELGPGPARQVLTGLLSDSGFDYVIQASDSDSLKIQSVLLLTRDKKDSKAADAELNARSAHSPYSRAAQAAAPAPAEETPAAEAPTATPAEVPVAEATPTEPPPAPSPTPTGPAINAPQGQQDQFGPNRPGAMTPPATLNQQSINQQLQLMYQQRAQINMQMNQAASPAGSATPGGK